MSLTALLWRAFAALLCFVYGAFLVDRERLTSILKESKLAIISVLSLPATAGILVYVIKSSDWRAGNLSTALAGLGLTISACVSAALAGLFVRSRLDRSDRGGDVSIPESSPQDGQPAKAGVSRFDRWFQTVESWALRTAAESIGNVSEVIDSDGRPPAGHIPASSSAGKCLPRQTAPSGPRLPYRAFISYSHVADFQFAPQLQSALERFAKPWYQARSFRIFRDVVNLSATPGLWPTIEAALDQSEYLIYLASPVAAKSKWVERELKHWRAMELAERSAGNEPRALKKLVIVLTDGTVEWDDSGNDFDWKRTTSLPPALLGAFTDMPLFVDMTGFRGNRISLDDEVFLDRVATIAATLHSTTKDAIFGEHIRQHRKTMRLAWSAVAALLILVAGVSAAAAVAYNEYRVAEDRRARSLDAAGRQRLEEGDWLGALPWFAQALAVPGGDLEESRRVRVGTIEAFSPRLTGLVVHDGRWSDVHWDGKRPRFLSIDSTDAVVHDPGARPSVGLRLPHGAVVNSAVFLPDGRRAATAGDDGRVVLWRLTGEGQASAFEKSLVHPGPVRKLAAHPDGRLLLTVCTAPTVRVGTDVVQREHSEARVWDLSTTDLAMPPWSPVDSTEPELDADFSPDGRLVLIAEGSIFSYYARAWSLATAQPAGPRFEPGILSPKFFGFDSDSRHVLFCQTAGNAAQIWDFATGQSVPLKSSRPFGATGFRDAAFRPGGPTLATAASDYAVEFWFSSNGEPVPTPTPIKHSDQVNSVRFSPDSLWMITAANDHTARLWDVVSRQPIDPPLNHNVPVDLAFFSPGGDSVVTVTNRDHTIRVWDVQKPQLASSVTTLFSEFGIAVSTGQGRVSQVVSSADGERVASVFEPINVGPGSITSTPMVRVGETRTGRAFSGPWVNPRAIAVKPSVALGPSGREVTAFLNSGALQVWSVDDGKPLARLEGPPRSKPQQSFNPDPINVHAAISPDGRWLAMTWDRGTALASRDHYTVLLWDLPAVLSGKPSYRQLLARESPIQDLSFSSDSRYLAVRVMDWASGIGEASLWEVASAAAALGPLTNSERPLRIAPGSRSYFTRVAVDPAGRLAAVASVDGRVQIWDLSSRRMLPAVEHGNAVNSVEFDPTGRVLLTASDDQTARIWDTATGTMLTDPLVHHEKVLDAVFLKPSAGKVVTRSADGSVRAWSKGGEPLSPPLRPGGWVWSAVFVDDSRLMMISDTSVKVGIWPLVPDRSPVSRLLALASTLSGQRVDSRTGALPLSPAELERNAETLSTLAVRGPSSQTSEQLDRTWHDSQAFEAAKALQWFAARWHLDRLIDSKTTDPALFIRRGFASSQLGFVLNAAEDFSRAIALRTTDWRAWGYRAEMSINQRRWQPAIDDLSITLNDPERQGLFFLWLERARAHAALGQWPQAASDFERALQLNPSIEDSWEGAALTHLAAGDKEEYRKRCAQGKRWFQPGADSAASGRAANINTALRVISVCIQQLHDDGDIQSLTPVLASARKYLENLSGKYTPEQERTLHRFVLYRLIVAYEAGSRQRGEWSDARQKELRNTLTDLVKAIGQTDSVASAQGQFYLALGQAQGLVGDKKTDLAAANEALRKATDSLAKQAENLSWTDRLALDRLKARVEETIRSASKSP
jgi:WD40 repeat protein/tetratricopeptide (TPR) repeat protein